MYFYVHKGRHIVVSETEAPASGSVNVVWLDLVSDIEGTKKRGRRPKYDKPIPTNELAPLEDSAILEGMRSRAEVVLEAVHNPAP